MTRWRTHARRDDFGHLRGAAFPLVDLLQPSAPEVPISPLLP